LAILLYTKSFVVYCLQAPLIFRHPQSCFFNLSSFNHPDLWTNYIKKVLFT